MKQVSTSTHNFISDIYSTIVEPDQWSGVLQQTAELAGAKAANICLVDYVAEELNSQFMCPETAAFYDRYMQSPYMDVELQAVSRLPQVLSRTEFYETGDFISKANKAFPEDQINLTTSEDWLFKEWEVRNRYISRLNIHPSYLDMHTLLFADIPEEQRLQGIQRVAELTQHFAKAVELSRPFLLLKSRFQATLDVLDRFQLGVFILSPGGAVILKNSAADTILEQADALSLDAHGKLRSDLAIDAPRLDKIIEQLLHEHKSGNIKSSTEVVFKRQSQLTPYLGEITPLSEPTIMGPSSGLIVTLIDPDNRKIINCAGMAQLFSLSDAESKVCQLLVDGYSTSEIAEVRSVSPITVKNQVNSVLSKTGNRSRTDLIRQALSINLPVEQSVA